MYHRHGSVQCFWLNLTVAWGVFWQLAAAGLLIPAVWAARCLVGVGEGVVMPAMNTLIAQHIPISLRSTALGNAYTGFHSGTDLGF